MNVVGRNHITTTALLIFLLIKINSHAGSQYLPHNHYHHTYHTVIDNIKSNLYAMHMLH